MAILIIVSCLISCVAPGASLITLIIFLIMFFKVKKHLKALEKIEDSDKYCADKTAEADKYCTDKKSEADNYYSEKEKLTKALSSEIDELKNEISDLKKESVITAINFELDTSITSEEYKNQFKLLKLEEAELIKKDEALSVNISSSKKAMRDNGKQILRSFDAECLNIINATTIKNIDTQRNKIQKSYENLNKIFEIDGIGIKPELLSYKFKELTLTYGYLVKKEQEKEEQKAIREQMLEEEKVRREIEREKARIEKEENQFKNEINKLMTYLHKSDDIEKQLYVDKIKELEGKLQLLEKDKENVLEREQNTRAGFVYVISNIGSFGENIYKIGMTRRLEPMDRVKELGDASVPFEFDVHAMIFSEDAPKLETALHTTFRANQVNKVNPRKEFFNVSLSEIEKVVKENHNAVVEFTEIAKAEQYRESLRIAESQQNN